jgi:putative ABC transport system ATP-binding protein
VYEIKDLTKTYRRGSQSVEALRGVTATIADGDLLAIQGPTGHGKSTLLQLLGGLDRPTSGSLRLGGGDLTRMSERGLTRIRAAEIGFVFQTFNLIPTLTARENVEAALVPLGVSADQRRRRAAEALADVGLAPRARHVPGELSGGEQQRVALARALVKQPRVILADEPTGNLDEDTRDEIMDLIERLWRERSLTVVIVTHDSAIAKRVPRVAWIYHGELSMRKESAPRSGAGADAGTGAEAGAPA